MKHMREGTHHCMDKYKWTELIVEVSKGVQEKWFEVYA